MPRKDDSQRPRQLTEKETEIMTRLWSRGPLFVREIVEDYPDPRPHFNTVSTTVRILEDKGYVGHEVVNGSHRYFAIASQEDFRTRSLGKVIRDYFNNSYASVVSALLSDEKISVDELKQIIEMVEKKKQSED